MVGVTPNHGDRPINNPPLPSFNKLMMVIEGQGLDVFFPYPCGDYVGFRRLELAAVLHRLRSPAVKGSQK